LSEDKRFEALGSDADTIVVIATSESMESPSNHYESWSEDIVFTTKGKSFRATINCSLHVYSGFEASLDAKKEITTAEYRRLAAGHEPEDVPAIRKRVKERASADAAASAAEAVRPNCPKCSKKMKVRTGNFPAFWGCSNYPKCDGTREKR